MLYPSKSFPPEAKYHTTGTFHTSQHYVKFCESVLSISGKQTEGYNDSLFHIHN
jgi:hypothetical protein